MTNIRNVLAKNMKAYRNALGLSQAKLAEKVGTSTHYIGMIETKNNFPSPEMIERIAAALGIDTLDLFSTDKKTPEAIKTYRKATIVDVKSLLGRFLDEKLKDLEK
jgi:transcriptional regulator with XRE-family HTH domain